MVNILKSRLPENTLKDLYKNILQQAMAMNKTSSGNLQIIDNSDQSLEVVISSGLSPEFLNHFKKVVTHDGSVCGRAMRTRKTVFITDVQHDQLFSPHATIAVLEGIHSIQSTPLISQNGKLIGIVSMHYKLPRRISDNHLSKFENFCSNTADKIEEYLN